MKKIEEISRNTHYSAVNIGHPSQLDGYCFLHPKTGKEVRGKVFLKESTGSTGTEISFTTLPPHTEAGYFHLHNKDEETYLILSGEGWFQVDDDCFPIKAGSVIRVAPEGLRSLCNTSDEQMVYVCVQSKEGSLEEYTSDDGTRLPAVPKWEQI